MRKTYWYHEKTCIPETGARTSSSEMHELCAACGKEGECVEVEISTNPDVRKTENWTMKPVFEASKESMQSEIDALRAAEAVEVTEGVSEEVAESIPLEDMTRDEQNEALATEVVKSVIREVEAETVEEPVLEASPVTEDTIDPEAQAKAVEAQEAKKAEIAALQAQIDALEKAK